MGLRVWKNISPRQKRNKIESSEENILKLEMLKENRERLSETFIFKGKKFKI